MPSALVYDSQGNTLSSCSEEKALKLVQEGKAELLSQEPLSIRLPYRVDIPEEEEPATEPGNAGQRILLHICCGPCATYSVRRLRTERWDVTGHWYNPNVQPFGEHERRRETLERYAREIDLPVLWEPAYEMPLFFRAVAGHEQYRERCISCYQLRLERTAQQAGAQGFDAFSTTLLVSPYQDQATIRRIAEGLAETYGVPFYYENLRRGFAESHQLARAHDLYMQRYCGCVYSEWEALDRDAATHSRG
ncbi:MAG: epoxyqueuosine reductase QueH [Anaerolineae bacterium]